MAEAREFLAGHASPFLALAEKTRGRPLGAWSLLRERRGGPSPAWDFVNEAVPVVVTVERTPGGLAVVRERCLFWWEDGFDAYRGGRRGAKWDGLVWSAARPCDFSFGMPKNGKKKAFFFQPTSTLRSDDGWDQHIPADTIAANAGQEFPEGTVQWESAWSFEVEPEAAKAALIEAGFSYSAKLNKV